MSQSRTPFLQAADAPNASRIQRLERFLFRQRPLNTAVPLAAQTSADPRVFQPTEEGSGSFGRWILDEAGLPAYEYQMDQYSDPRAAYPNTEGLDRRDHWHQVGNQRVTAMASNDGTVQVYLCDRGGVFLNRFEAWEYDRPKFQITSWLFSLLRTLILFITKLLRRPASSLKPVASAEFQAMSAQSSKSSPPRGIPSLEVLAQLGTIPRDMLSAQSVTKRTATKSDPTARYAHAGGFGYVDNGSEVWGTAFRYRPQGAHNRRIFGVDYFESETTYQNIRVIRRVYAPYGDDPALIADVQIENLGSNPIDLCHYEYWDVNVHQLQIEWLRSGAFGSTSDTTRREVNRHFNTSVEWDETTSALRFKQQLRQPPPTKSRPPTEPSDIDWDPAHIFLADLSGKPDAFYINKSAFFGTGGARQPDAVRQRKSGDAIATTASSDPMPYCLVMRRDLNLQPGERKSLRYAYGTSRPNGTLGFLDKFRQQSDLFNQTLASWKDNLAYFYTGEDPVLQREMAWHAYNLLSATVYVDFYKAHIVPQGSAYLYLHGADGAPRDQALFALPGTYLDPSLARDMLRLIMQVTHADTGQISYSFAGYGFLSDGLGVYSNPSDLDLFFLLALCEYLSATGDVGFLDQPVPFYPPTESPPGATVLDHVHRAVKHLFEVNGIGENGLIKVGTNDWSDSIVTETALQDGLGFAAAYTNSKQHGESIPNTQMALYVLPLLAAILKDRDPEFVDYIYDAPSQPGRLERLRLALQDQWNSSGWYNRAILRNFQNHRRVIELFSLEAQVWALISGVAKDDGKEGTLIDKVDALLDRPSLIGGTLIPDGMVWPAISQLLTWAYAHTNRGQLAWRSLHRNTFAMHSQEYPNIWFNTWSGPDGINGRSADPPGGTWFSPLTPMTDFPVMNANQDAMALLGLLRVCGIEPSLAGDGLVIHPRVPKDNFILEMPLIRLEVAPKRIFLRYRAFVTGSRAFYIHHSMGNVTVKVDDQTVSVEQQDDQVVVPVQFEKDQIVHIEVTST